MDIRMTEQEHGMTVKTYLHTVLHLSGAQVTALKKDPVGILANGTHVTVRYVLKTGDVLSLRGAGKGKITGTGGNSRKGRLFVYGEIYK